MGIPTGGFEGVDPGFEPIPSGVYAVEVTGAEETEVGEGSKKYPGAPMLKVEMEVNDPEHEEYAGRKLWTNVVIHEKTKGLQKGFLLGVGYSEEVLDDPNFEIDPDDLIGRMGRAVVTVGKNPKTGEPNNSVRRILPIEEGETASLPS